MDFQCKISFDSIKNIPVMHIDGDLTSDADKMAKNIYHDIKEKFPADKIIIDFNKAKYINSSGFAILLNIIEDIDERKGTVAFVGLSNYIKKIMYIIGITDFVKIFGDLKEAANTI